jgi:hypothetical protein
MPAYEPIGTSPVSWFNREAFIAGQLGPSSPFFVEAIVA